MRKRSRVLSGHDHRESVLKNRSRVVVRGPRPSVNLAILYIQLRIRNNQLSKKYRNCGDRGDFVVL